MGLRPAHGATAATCPAGHTLARMRGVRCGFATLDCDAGCGGEMPASAWRWSCPRCNYDVCVECEPAAAVAALAAATAAAVARETAVARAAKAVAAAAVEGVLMKAREEDARALERWPTVRVALPEADLTLTVQRSELTGDTVSLVTQPVDASRDARAEAMQERAEKVQWIEKHDEERRKRKRAEAELTELKSKLLSSPATPAARGGRSAAVSPQTEVSRQRVSELKVANEKLEKAEEEKAALTKELEQSKRVASTVRLAGQRQEKAERDS